MSLQFQHSNSDGRDAARGPDSDAAQAEPHTAAALKDTSALETSPEPGDKVEEPG